MGIFLWYFCSPWPMAYIHLKRKEKHPFNIQQLKFIQSISYFHCFPIVCFLHPLCFNVSASHVHRYTYLSHRYCFQMSVLSIYAFIDYHILPLIQCVPHQCSPCPLNTLLFLPTIYSINTLIFRALKLFIYLSSLYIFVFN